MSETPDIARIIDPSGEVILRITPDGKWEIGESHREAAIALLRSLMQKAQAI